MSKNLSLLQNSFITGIVDEYSQEPSSITVQDKLIQGLQDFAFDTSTTQGLLTARENFINLPDLTIRTRKQIKEIFHHILTDEYTPEEQQLLSQVYSERGSVPSLGDLIANKYPDSFSLYQPNLGDFNTLQTLQGFCDELILQHKFSFEKRMLADQELNVAVFKDLSPTLVDTQEDQVFEIVDITQHSAEYNKGASLNMLDGKTRLGEIDTNFIDYLNVFQQSSSLSLLSLAKFEQLSGALASYYQTLYPTQTLNSGDIAKIIFGLTGYTGDFLLKTDKNTDKKQRYFHSEGLTGSFGIANASKDTVGSDPFKNHKYRIILSD